MEAIAEIVVRGIVESPQQTIAILVLLLVVLGLSVACAALFWALGDQRREHAAARREDVLTMSAAIDKVTVAIEQQRDAMLQMWMEVALRGGAKSPAKSPRRRPADGEEVPAT